MTSISSNDDKTCFPIKIKWLTFLASACILMSLMACSPSFPDSAEQDDITRVAANQIGLSVAIVHNYTADNCPYQATSCYQATMTLTLAESMPQNWRIVFSHLSPIAKALSDDLRVQHLNGDLHQISAKQNNLKANTAYTVSIYGFTPLISHSVLFPNYLLVDTNGNAHVIKSTKEVIHEGEQVARHTFVEAFTKPEQYKRASNDNVPIADANERYARFTSRNLRQTALTTSTPVSEPTITNESVRIIPKLQDAAWSNERLSIDKGINIQALHSPNALLFDASIKAITDRFSALNIPLAQNGIPLKPSLNKDLPNEAYTLAIHSAGIDLSYADGSGLYYALMTIGQLYNSETNSLPVGYAQDSPYLPFRGLHIDVSRNFRDKDFLLGVLDQMAYYKLNKLHLHLGDDEGWRLQIASLPELTEVGAKRCFDESETKCLMPQLAGGNGISASVKRNSGYYSKADYIEILQYANARQIEVVPSLDMPGHSRAAMVSMLARYHHFMAQDKPKQAKEFLLTELDDISEYRSIQHYNDNTLNPCLPATYRFVKEVLMQLNQLHLDAGVPLKRYHIGADETAGAWTKSPACIEYIKNTKDLDEISQLGPHFIERVANMVNAMGVTTAAWSDGLSHANAANLPEAVQSNAWETLSSGGHNKAHEMLNKGWQVVLSTPDVLYFDFPYEADTLEPGYYWGSRYTDTYQVFQFMPSNLPVHAEIWTDSLGNSFVSNADVNLLPNKQISGIQGQLWSETVRSNEQAHYMLFPRLFALAERAWHTPSWVEAYQAGVSYSANTGHFSADQKLAMQADWLSFTKTLTQQAMVQLVNEGIIPRVPLPGAKIMDGKLYMRSALPGLTLQYQINDGDWTDYKNAVDIIDDHNAKSLKIRSKIPRTDVVSREQTLTPESTTTTTL